METPTRPGTTQEVSDAEKAVLDERLKTADQEAKSAVDAKKALAEIRRQLKQPRPN